MLIYRNFFLSLPLSLFFLSVCLSVFNTLSLIWQQNPQVISLCLIISCNTVCEKHSQRMTEWLWRNTNVSLYNFFVSASSMHRSNCLPTMDCSQFQLCVALSLNGYRLDESGCAKTGGVHSESATNPESSLMRLQGVTYRTTIRTTPLLSVWTHAFSPWYRRNNWIAADTKIKTVPSRHFWLSKACGMIILSTQKSFFFSFFIT